MSHKIKMLCVMAIALAGALTGSLQAQTDEEEAHPSSNSASFNNSFDATVSELAQRHFGEGLKRRRLGSEADDTLNRLTGEIAKESPLPGVRKEVTGAEYDVVLQPGHYLRTTGKLGTQGSRVSERALVSYIVGPMADALRAKGLRVLVVPADPTITGSLTTHVFLAVHADGNSVRCTGKASLGYSQDSSPFAMHAIGWGLSQALGYSYSSFHQDNFTANESHYYMFSQVKGDALRGILEIGELTCPEKEDMLITASRQISANLARAVEFVLGK